MMHILLLLQRLVLHNIGSELNTLFSIYQGQRLAQTEFIHRR